MNAYELKNIEQRYNGNTVLRIDDYCIASNSVTALVGPNGSGKSTLLDIIALINNPVAGTLKFFNQEVRREDHESLRRRIGYIQQKPYLLNTSVYKNIELGLKLRNIEKSIRQERVNHIIERFQLGHLAERRAHMLSGGEAQKVAIARAMVLEPEVLILDEPFSHLDKNFNQEFETLIRSIRQTGKQTVVFSSHDHLQAQILADQVCSLIDGHWVPTSAINLITGEVEPQNHLFISNHLKIHIPAAVATGTRLTIDSRHLVLSGDELKSSMRNSFPGVIKSIKEEDGEIHVNVDIGELFHVLITRSALNELGVNVGDAVWVSFKSTAARIF